VTFEWFHSFVLSDTGQVAFTAALTGPAVGEHNSIGLWAESPDGGLLFIAREGTEIEISPGEILKVSSIGFASYPGDETTNYCLPTTFNGRGELVFGLSFTRGPSGIFIAEVPEPGSAVLLACGGLILLRLRRRRSPRVSCCAWPLRRRR